MSQASRKDAPPSRGQWLRQQRQSRGWSVPEMRRHLREAARDAGDTLPGNECLGVMIRRWEKDEGGVSERYRMHYCRAFGLPLAGFGAAPLPASEPGTQDCAATPLELAGLPLGEDERAELVQLSRQYAELYARHRKLKRDLYAWISRAMNEDQTRNYHSPAA